MPEPPERRRRGLTVWGVVITVALLAILAATTNVELYDPMAADGGLPVEAPSASPAP